MGLPRIKFRVCENCGKEFETRISDAAIRDGRGRFCTKGCWYQWKTTPLSVRFQKYVGPTTERGCILWVGYKDKDGYGNIKEGGTVVLAHRAAYELTYGPISGGLQVLHTCDNPPCINIEHLFLGTPNDNVADKVAKGRQARGDCIGIAKLNEDVIREIRLRYAAGGISQEKLGAEFGVTQVAVGLIIRRKTWAHVE